MSTTTPRTRRTRFGTAAALLVAVVAAMLAQVAIADTAIAATPRATAVQARTATTLSLNNGNRTFDVGPLAISGAFLNARNHRGVSGASIQIWSHAISGGGWVHIANARTNAAGKFSVTVNATSNRLYQARFAGTGSWAASTSRNTRINVVRVKTRVASQSVSHPVIAFGAGVDIRGILIDARNHRVARQRVELWSLLPGAKAWVHTANATTSSTGTYVFSPRTLTKTINYQVRFPATGKWVSVSGPALRVTVAKSKTTVAVALLHASVGSGASEVVSGSITDALHRRVAGQRVEVYSQTAGSAAWVHLGSASTNSGGAYGFSTGALAATTSFQVRYAATAFMNTATSATVKATVTAPAPPKPPVVVPPTSTEPPVPVGWSSNPKLAADTIAGVNAYRAKNHLPTLETYSAADGVDSCVEKNTVGTFCDPGNLASGYTTGPAVVAAWAASPGHNAAMLDDTVGRMSCAAYTHSDGMSADVGCQFDF